MVQTSHIGRKLAQKRHKKAAEHKAELPEVQEPAGLTPAQIVAQWQAEGVIGAWKHKGIEDSSAYARELRAKAERREHED